MKQKPSRPFGRPSAFIPGTGAYVPLGDVAPFHELTILEVGHDALLCSDREGRPQVVLKPWSLRKSSFHGEAFEVDGVEIAYASTGIDERTATPDGESAVTERVVTPYFVGEKIAAYRRAEIGLATVGTGELTDVAAAADYRLEWEDVNTAARRWQGPEYEFIGALFENTSGGMPTSFSALDLSLFRNEKYVTGMTSVGNGRVKVTQAGWYKFGCVQKAAIPDAKDWSCFWWNHRTSLAIGALPQIRNYSGGSLNMALNGGYEASLVVDDDIDFRTLADGGTLSTVPRCQWSVKFVREA